MSEVGRVPVQGVKPLPDLDGDLASFPGYSYETTETLLRVFDEHVSEARAALGAASDEDFEVPWSLKHGEQVLARKKERKEVLFGSRE